MGCSALQSARKQQGEMVAQSLRLHLLGSWKCRVLGDAALANAAPTADASATSSDSQHTVDQLTDGDAATYWASSADSPVDVQLDFGSIAHIKAVEIDWERPAQAKRPGQKL